MTQNTRMKCVRCGNPATAGPHPHYPNEGQCIPCAAVTTTEIPRTLEKLNMVPEEIVRGPAWPIASPFSQRGALWRHQANALHELCEGNNIVISTATASGKSMVFQLWTFQQVMSDPQATAAIFYPTKALGNDQTRRWKQQASQLGLPGEIIAKIDGDVHSSMRPGIMDQARAIVMTPDVCHAWTVPRAANIASVKRFLQNLRIIIIDEAHIYEGVLGSNSAYLFRRLLTTARYAGNDGPIQFIAATATIQDPEVHLKALTGETFQSIDESQNGTPRFTRTLHHVATEQGGGNREEQAAQLLLNIIDNDPNAQVIVFHDSRMGVEMIARCAGRPDTVRPYRAGYLPENRVEIENQLRDNTIRAVITTNALELGIDMPDLNYGINIDLPGTRKRFHQRLGRIGRSRPGTFIVLADRQRFRRYGETLQEYYDNSVEPSLLYLDNEYITFQQAQCLKDEMQRFQEDTMLVPEHCSWPQEFHQALRNTNGRVPPHLANLAQSIGTKQPQLVHQIRSTGEENMEIFIPGQTEKIGDISVSQALREAYPQAVYPHEGRTYRIEEWRRDPDNNKPLIRATPMRSTAERTKPILRQMTIIDMEPENIIGNRHTRKKNGEVAELKVNITESVEGLESSQDGMLFYRNLMKVDPRRTRMQHEFPTTALHIRMEDRHFTGFDGAAWQARQQIARALRDHLSYRKSIASREIGSMTDNIIVKTPQGCWISNRSILIFDRIYGGLDLIRDLYENLEYYAERIRAGALSDRRANFQDYAQKFLQWVREEEGNQADFLQNLEPADPGKNDWWRVVRPGSQARIFSERQGQMAQGQVREVHWDDGIRYTLKLKDESVEISDDQITSAGSATLDWQMWRPLTNHFQELQTGA